MGNQLKKKGKDKKTEKITKNDSKKEKKEKEEIEEQEEKEEEIPENERIKEEDYPDAKFLKEEKSLSKVNLMEINRQTHTLEKGIKDPIVSIITHPNFIDSVIIATKQGKIKLFTNITQYHSKNDNEFILYDFKNETSSLILLKKNDNKICVGSEGCLSILIIKSEKKANLDIILNNNKIKEPALLEQENGNIISAGLPIILWKKKGNNYNEDNNIIQNDLECNFINILEFPEINTILVTQENTHLIYYLRYKDTGLELIKKIEDVPSIGYKNSAQKLSNNFMILIGKFRFNVIDALNGEVCNDYPGIDRAAIINLTEYEDDTENIWVISEYQGAFFEFYTQQGNDLVYLDRVKLKEKKKISWKNTLVKINKECFAAVNWHGEIIAFKMELKKK